MVREMRTNCTEIREALERDVPESNCQKLQEVVSETLRRILLRDSRIGRYRAHWACLRDGNEESKNTQMFTGVWLLERNQATAGGVFENRDDAVSLYADENDARKENC